jgi:hypothetical protein
MCPRPSKTLVPSAFKASGDQEAVLADNNAAAPVVEPPNAFSPFNFFWNITKTRDNFNENHVHAVSSLKMIAWLNLAGLIQDEYTQWPEINKHAHEGNWDATRRFLNQHPKEMVYLPFLEKDSEETTAHSLEWEVSCLFITNSRLT